MLRKADSRFIGAKLQLFLPAPDSEIKELNFNSPNESYELDPLPTWLLRQCIQQLLQPITAILIGSLAEAMMPSGTKCSAVTLLLKRV